LFDVADSHTQRMVAPSEQFELLPSTVFFNCKIPDITPQPFNKPPPPLFWSLQVYHASITVAFASQIMDQSNWQTVLAHIIQWTGVPTDPKYSFACPVHWNASTIQSRKKEVGKFIECVVRFIHSKSSNALRFEL
jgi:hypothetical protein